MDTATTRSKHIAVTTYTDARDFLRRANGFLEARPDANHHIIQVCNLAAKTSDFLSAPYGYWALEDSVGTLVGCAVHVRPDGLILSNMPEYALPGLLNEVRKSGIEFARVVCSYEQADILSSALRDILTLDFQRQKIWTLGRLDALGEDSNKEDANLRLARDVDSDLVSRWASQYQVDEPSFIDVREFMAMKLDNQELYLLEFDGTPRSMATVSGRTPLGTRLSSVYTDVGNRRNGYAKKIVCQLSRQLLQNGSKFVLLTWNTGEAAGTLYKKIGFRAVGRFVSLTQDTANC